MELVRVPSDGWQLAVLRQGHGRPVVLVHGWMGNHTDMRSLADELASDHAVYVVDVRGHGDSEPSARSGEAEFGLEQFADDVAAVVTFFGLAPALVVGHSMGGAVGLTLAARNPELVGKLVMVDSPWALQPPDSAVVESAVGLWGPAFGPRRERLHLARVALLGRDVGVEPSQPVAAAALTSLMAWDGRSARRDCNRPVYAIFADAHWPALGVEAKAYSNVRAENVSGTGHWVHVERPEAVATCVRAFEADQLIG